MPSVWRQGDLVAPEHAIALGLPPDQRHSHRLLVASHSCDIASREDSESQVELLLAVVVSESQATSQNGHGVRRLHVPAHFEQSVEWLELGITHRHMVSKAELLARDPWSNGTVSPKHRGILRRWLAQRYVRSEFPDAFVRWMGQSGMAERLDDKIAKRYSHALIGIYFDLDDDTEREDPDDPYTLGIQLVYDTEDSTHAAAAGEAAMAITQLFNARCRRQGRWWGTELLYCDPIADTAFSLRAAHSFRRWRLEHRSIGGEPIDVSE